MRSPWRGCTSRCVSPIASCISPITTCSTAWGCTPRAASCSPCCGYASPPASSEAVEPDQRESAGGEREQRRQRGRERGDLALFLGQHELAAQRLVDLLQLI